VSVGAGGSLAYASLIVFLGGLGAFAAFGFSKLGWEPALAAGVGLGCIGLLGMIIGGLMARQGVKSITKVSPAPERTLETFQQLSRHESTAGKTSEIKEKVKDKVEELRKDEPQRSSAEIQTSVLDKQQAMAETLEELTDRASLRHLRRKASHEAHAHPYRWGLAAMGTGLAGGYLLQRKRHHHGNGHGKVIKLVEE